MDLTLQEIKEFLLKFKLTKQIEKFSINLYFLSKGLKPSILWDFGTVNSTKLANLRTLFGTELLILELSGDFFISFKSKLVRTLKECLINLPVFIDVSEDLETPIEASAAVRDMIVDMVECVVEQVDATREDAFLALSVEENWNLSSLFGILLGFPVVYYFDISGDNCLGNLDLTVWSVGVRQVGPISFSVPASMEGLVERRVMRWWEEMTGHKEWRRNIKIGELNILCQRLCVNMPVVTL